MPVALRAARALAPWPVTSALVALLGASTLRAQSPADTAPVRRRHASPHTIDGAVGAQLVAGGTRLANALDGRTLTEGYVSQPAIMAHAALLDGHLTFTGTLNFEGLTLKRGELLGGVYGEGYVDRRHPHTFVHEAVAAAQGSIGAVHASLAAGKGFAPFGTDDPMMRPFERYPVNHHLAQILERAIVVGAVRVPRVLLEVAAFNGDEPTGPWAWPRWSRFGDSWSARLSVEPFFGSRDSRLGYQEDPDTRVPSPEPRSFELSGSVASVRAPENPDGGGLDQRKWSAAARWAHGAPLGGASGDRGSYALVEWARTDWMRGGERVTLPGYRDRSVLAEGGVRRHGIEVVARAEQTDRQEEERLVDPFRAVRPASDVSILGLTEWRVFTVGASVPRVVGHGTLALRVAPSVEWSVLSPRAVVRPTVFDPVSFYGSSHLWALTAGVRIGAGMRHARMGRYGVAAPSHGGAMAMPDMMGMP